MSQDQVLMKFIGQVKAEQAEIAEAGMLRPKRELFALGETSGNYQGLQRALDILDSIIRDKEEKERSS